VVEFSTLRSWARQIDRRSWDDFSEPGIVTYSIRSRFAIEIYKVITAFLPGAFQPGEGLFVIAESGEGRGEMKRGHVTLPRDALEGSQYAARLLLLACGGIGVGECHHNRGAVRGVAYGLP
jgi:hypothetical protein